MPLSLYILDAWAAFAGNLHEQTKDIPSQPLASSTTSSLSPLPPITTTSRYCSTTPMRTTMWQRHITSQMDEMTRTHGNDNMNAHHSDRWRRFGTSTDVPNHPDSDNTSLSLSNGLRWANPLPLPCVHMRSRGHFTIGDVATNNGARAIMMENKNR